MATGGPLRVLSDVPKWRRLREGIGAIEPAPEETSSPAAA